MGQKNLDAQEQRWEEAFREWPEMFGPEPSIAARRAAERFKREEAARVLELGCGHGRDTIWFARNGFVVSALDYSAQGLEALEAKARELNIANRITLLRHDVRTPLPFADAAFDACYSHMLLCMALTSREIESLSREIRRILKPGGLNVYTVRNTADAHYRRGIHRGGALWEIDGRFVVHFFSREKVERLAAGYEILAVEEFEEGEVRKQLFSVTLRKEAGGPGGVEA